MEVGIYQVLATTFTCLCFARRVRHSRALHTRMRARRGRLRFIPTMNISLGRPICPCAIVYILIFGRFRDRLSFRLEGIRYAPQPERFTYSSLYEGTGNNASATTYGSECVQGATRSEDCLFLNIWTPYLSAHGGAPKSDLKPVMFWIH